MLADVHHQHPKVLALKVRTLTGIALQAIGLVAGIRMPAFAGTEFMLQRVLACVNLLLQLLSLRVVALLGLIELGAQVG